MVGSLGEGTSRWWGVWVRGPRVGGEFEWENKRWWGIG